MHVSVCTYSCATRERIQMVPLTQRAVAQFRQQSMGKGQAAKAHASAQPSQPCCNIDAPNASSDSEHLFAWACYGMMAAARALDDGSARVEKVAYELIERGESAEFKRLDSCDADDDQVSFRLSHLNSRGPGNASDIPCLQLLQECGATPLNAHQLLYVHPRPRTFNPNVLVQLQCGAARAQAGRVLRG